MAEFNAGLQTQQEERYAISLFLLLLGVSFTRFFMTFALAVPPLTLKNRDCALNRSCALNQKNTVINGFALT